MDTTLEMQIKTTGQEALKVLKELNTTMTGLVTTLNKVKDSTSSIENLGKASEKTLGKVDKLSTSFNKLFSAMVGKKFAMKALDFLDSASNRAEEMNLFNVIFKNVKKNGEQTFSDLGLAATRFQHKLNEAFGTNMTETMRYQGLFQAMATNQGIGEKYASIMSENMLKLTYDLASLYNRSEKTTAEALRGGVYAGQTKPLRSFGIDVTQTSMKPVLESLGITDRSINDMSQAEKQILRYIATLNQAKAAMGDFAETIESPANQMKIFKQQLVEAKVALGNLFMGVYSEVLPYANAFLMVVKEVAQALAEIFGIETGDYNSGLASTEEIYDGIADGAGNATKATKELKRQLLKFDEVNNITTPKNNGSGSGSGLGNSGIDQRLLDAIKGYDNLMDKVKMKATEIRDRWMEILGFKKVIDPLTGKIKWKYQGLETTIKNLIKWFGDLSAKGKLFVALGLELIFGKIFKSVSKLAGGLTKTDTAMGKFMSNVGNKITTVVKGLGIATIGVLTLNAALEDMANNGINWGNQLSGLAGSLMTMFGAAQIGSIFGPVGSLVGAAIGGISSLIIAIGGIGNAFDQEKVKINNAKEETEKTIQEWANSIKNMKDAMVNSDSEMEYYQNLKNELDSIVDKNGKVKKGYEDRATFITGELARAFGIEINIVDGVIEKYGELKGEIDNLILEKKAMAKLNVLEEEYNDALRKRKQAKKDLTEAEQLYNNLVFDQNVLIEQNAKKMGISKDEMIALFDEILKSPFDLYSADLREAAEEYANLTSKITDQYDVYQNNIQIVENYQNTIDTFSEAYTLALKKDWDALDKFMDGQAQLLGEDEKTKLKFWKSERQNAEQHLKELADNKDKYNKKEYENLVAVEEAKIKKADDYYAKLEALTKTRNGEITDEVVKEWIKMGEESVDKAVLEFQKLPANIQQQLSDKMMETGTKLGLNLKGKVGEALDPKDREYFERASKIAEELKKGFDSVKLTKTIDIIAKDNASQTINNIINKYKNNPFFAPLFKAINKFNGGIFNGTSWSNIPQYANGGMPTHGTLFSAGENGAEIVGNINRRTEVLNRSQIASAIYSAVVSAMSQFNGGSSQIDVHVHTDEGTVVDRINQKTKQTGRCPIDMPAY